MDEKLESARGGYITFEAAHQRDATPGLHRLGENKVWVCCLTCLIYDTPQQRQLGTMNNTISSGRAFKLPVE